MNRVKPVGVHVIRKPAGATNSGNKNDILARDAQLRHDALRLRENGVIATARAPTHILVGFKILSGEGRSGTGNSGFPRFSVGSALESLLFHQFALRQGESSVFARWDYWLQELVDFCFHLGDVERLALHFIEA